MRQTYARIGPLPRAYRTLPLSIWYQRARYDIQRVLPPYLDYQTFAAVVALISPGRRWSNNIADAITLVDAWHNDSPIPRSLATYSMAHIDKAIAYLQTYDETLITGQKVRAFYHCLIDPTAAPDAPIDRHMRHAWFKTTEDKPVTPREYRILHRRLIRLANSRHIPPCSLQASIWEHELSMPHIRKDKPNATH